MKRWQDFGEVPDSDEEDLDIATESRLLYPTHASKKPRIGNVQPSSGSPELKEPEGRDSNAEADDLALFSGPQPAKTYARQVKTSKHLNQEAPTHVPQDSRRSPSLHHAFSAANVEQQVGQSTASHVTDEGRTVEEARPAANDEVEEFQSLASSPLSERDVSPPSDFHARLFGLPSSETPRLVDLTTEAADERTSQDVPHSSPSLQELLASAREETRSRRTFRARNEQQLHPYMYEKLAYQRQWKERGLQPIQVAEAKRAAEEAQDASVSEEESQSVSRSRSSPVLNSSPRRNEGSDAGATVSHMGPLSMHGSDDDLPDIDAALRHKIPDISYAANKRRRLNRQAVPDTRRMVAVVPGARPRTEELDEYAIPPSPPPTSSTSDAAQITAQKPKPSFRLPPGMSPVSLPTPQVSSTARHHPSSDSSVDDGPTQHTKRRSMVNVPNMLTSESEVSSSPGRSASEVEDVQMRKEKRRIRGVLPASWLKIDAKGQVAHISKSPTKTRQHSPSPSKTMPQKGVAQRVHGNGLHHRSLSRGEISDDSSNDSEPQRSSHVPVVRQRQLSFSDERLITDRTTVIDDYGEMEADWVDPMWGRGPRSTPSATRKSKKRQPRIKDAFERIRQDGHTDPGMSREHHVKPPKPPQGSGSRLSKRRNISQKKPKLVRTPAPKLSILDAPPSTGNGSGATPTFIRLARRTAHSRPDKGRHSPSHKTLRLVTDEDTQDATHTLRAWRAHDIVASRQLPSATPSRSVQRGLNENGGSLGKGSNNQERALKPKQRERVTTKPIRVIRPNLQANGHRQSRLAPGLLAQQQLSQVDLGQLLTHADDGTQQQPKRMRNQASRQQHRGAQLESLERDFDEQHYQAAVEKRIYSFTEAIARRNRVRAAPDFQINRFMYDSASRDVNIDRAKVQAPENLRSEVHGHGQTTKLPYRPRKRQARRIDIDTREYRQPSEPLPDVDLTGEGPEQTFSTTTNGPALLGLGPFGFRYPTDFDIRPLPLGTYFHASTFVGSGGLADALAMDKQELDHHRGQLVIQLDSRALRWSTWNEEVSSDFNHVLHAIVSAAEILLEPENDDIVRAQRDAGVIQTVDYLLKSIVRYCAKCLSFLDAIDRVPCAERVGHFVQDLGEVLESRDTLPRAFKSSCLLYSCVLSRQALYVCDHHAVPKPTRQFFGHLLQTTCLRLASINFPVGFRELREFYESIKRQRVLETGIQASASSSVHAVTVLHHVLRSNGDILHFWAALSKASISSTTTWQTISALDNEWYNLFSILPMMELNVHGTLQVASRFTESSDDWSIPKRLLSRLIELYPATAAQHGSTVNDYVRATFVRCHCLIIRWGWWRCESVLGLIFDFFAKRGMAPLQSEESHGSPAFLGELDGSPALEVRPEDRSFGIFLKALAAGLQGMRKHAVYNAKKIGGITWRFIPNHGRTYRKDAELQQADLDALRNHHDLLCTLYYASPAGYRVRLDLLRSLVDHSSSHREACRLSVRAWSNLAAFQVSAAETTTSLEPFEAWYHEMLAATIAQYRLAKPEAEHQFAIAKAQGAEGMTEQLLDRTVASNQRQIVATLVDLLAAMKRAVTVAKSMPSARSLIRGSGFWAVFELFEPSNQRVGGMLKDALALVRTCLEQESARKVQPESQNTSDDSQDWGDSSALHEFAAAEDFPLGGESGILEDLQEPISQLLSSAFGAETHPDDSFLMSLVDSWVLISTKAIAAGLRSWTSCIDPYATTSWFQLLDTPQRRKFTGYYLAKLVESGCCVSDEARQIVVQAWLISLVEREGTLKFQHCLTSALLNYCDAEPLLENLPYSRATKSGLFEITPQDFRQRRLSTISSVLCSIQAHFFHANDHGYQAALAVKRTCSETIRHLMTAMKSHYQELQADGQCDVAQADMQGSYVDFVQSVVAMLQEYVSDICQVDPFFTDSAAFPLPAIDPTYVVGKLRSYIPKLRESRQQKLLATFVHAVTERAVVDGQQQYLISQLSTALSDDLELGGSNAPTLRHVLLTAVFPVYAAGCLTSTSAWILALPILHACASVVRDLLYGIRYEDASSVQSASDVLYCLLVSLVEPVQSALDHPGLLRLAHVRKTLAAVFDVATACTTTVQHLKRSSGVGGGPMLRLKRLAYLARCVDAALTDREDAPMLDGDDEQEGPSNPWPDTSAFATRQAHEAFRDNWKAVDGQYNVRRGQGWREVQVDIGDEGEEGEALMRSLASFHKAHGRIVSNAHSRRLAGRDASGACGADALIV